MPGALEIQSTVSAEAAKARAAFTETHGRSIQIGNVHYYEKSFRGTKRDIQGLHTLAQTPEFQKTYPDHYVYALGREIIGSMPKHPPNLDSNSYRDVLLLHLVKQLQKEVLHYLIAQS